MKLILRQHLLFVEFYNIIIHPCRCQRQKMNGSLLQRISILYGSFLTVSVQWMENIQPPAHSGSYYFNYKHSFSIVLLAVVDADYKFLYVDIGCNGRTADRGVFKNSDLYAALENKSLNIPSPKPIQENERPLPYMIVADDAFPLKEYIQKPYSQVGLTTKKRIFNYRLSRARRIVENAFGILSNRFRVFMTPMRLAPEKVETVVLACCSLHNFLRSRQGSRSIYTPPGSMDSENGETHRLTPGDWRLNEHQWRDKVAITTQLLQRR